MVGAGCAEPPPEDAGGADEDDDAEVEEDGLEGGLWRGGAWGSCMMRVGFGEGGVWEKGRYGG